MLKDAIIATLDNTPENELCSIVGGWDSLLSWELNNESINYSNYQHSNSYGTFYN